MNAGSGEPSSLPVTQTAVGPRNEWLDSIRGYAVLIVCASHLLYLPPIKHALPHLTRYFKGDIGVWMFYVLSGFLIAGLLEKEKERTGQVRLGRFYGRRLSRLVPSYLALVAFLIGHRWLGGPGIAWWLYLIPWLDMTAGIGYLPYHLKTLHIEEKFYLLWGLISKVLSARVLAVIAVGLLIYGPVARVLVFRPGGPSMLMFDSAADCFGIGILLALSGLGTSRAKWDLSSLLNFPLFRPGPLLVAMLVIGTLRTTKPFSYALMPFLPTVIAVLSALMLLAGWQRRSALQFAGMAKLGLMSYTVYLFQQLVLCPWNEVYTTPFTWTRWIIATLLCIVFVVAWFHLVESKVTRWGKNRFSSH